MAFEDSSNTLERSSFAEKDPPEPQNWRNSAFMGQGR